MKEDFVMEIPKKPQKLASVFSNFCCFIKSPTGVKKMSRNYEFFLKTENKWLTAGSIRLPY